MSKRMLSRIAVILLFLTGILLTVGNACSENGAFHSETFATNHLGSAQLPFGPGAPTLPPTGNPTDFPFSPTLQPELKPLSPREYDRSISVILGITDNLGKSNLPEATAAPFDNDSASNTFTKAHIESFEYTAGKVAEAFLSSSSKNNFIPCTPKSASDRACLEKFTVQLASLAFRKLATANEVKDIVDLALSHATTNGKFDDALKTAIQVVLQDPQFLYRMEIGQSTTEGFKLSDMEYLSKMTYFVLGGPPSLQQIQQVSQGALNTEEGRKNFVTNLLNDSRVVDQMDLIHAQWLGFSALGEQSTQSKNFRTETRALIQKTLNENLPWRNLLTSDETYVNSNLAKIYDLQDQSSSSWNWQKYKDEFRQGILSHGSFLSVGVKFGDTSTTRRGYNIQKSLFCGSIGRPPSVDENGNPVDIDEPPASDTVYECKEDLYRNTLLAQQSCAVCHSMMDSIAFGLENFGTDGSFRTTEPNKPSCSIRGQGAVTVFSQGQMLNLGSFKGPKQLANLALQSGFVENCFATRIIEFSIGRKLSSQDSTLIQKVNSMNKTSSNFKTFLQSFLLSPEFRIRKGS